MSVMSRAAIPPPVAFDLDAAESARLRDTYVVAAEGRLSMMFAAFAIGLQSLPPVIRLFRYRGNDPFDWALLAVAVALFAVALFAIACPRCWQRLFARSQDRKSVRS